MTDHISRERAASIIEALLKKREVARSLGDYELADRIRDVLAKYNIIVRDTPTGPSWIVIDVKPWKV